MSVLHVLEISGSPRERGWGHGEELRDLVRERDRRWRTALEDAAGVSSDIFIERFLQETRFVPAIERWAPDLLDEVRGLAEGSGLPYDSVLAAQFMDEEWWFVEQFKGLHHCSSLGARDPGGRRALAAQNMDLVTWTDGLQTLLRMRGPGQDDETYVLTMAGMIGLCGTTPRLALCVNTLGDLRSRPDGLPVAFVARTALAQGTRKAAVDFLGRVPHASGQNYVVVDAEGVTDLECSAGGAAEVPGGDLVWHTNHAIASSDRDREPDETAPGRRNSRCRMASLDGRLGGAGAVDVAAAKQVLSARDDPGFPVSIPAFFAKERGTGFFTFASVVYEVGDSPAVYVAPGAPCTVPYRTFAFGPAAERAAAE